MRGQTGQYKQAVLNKPTLKNPYLLRLTGLPGDRTHQTISRERQTADRTSRIEAKTGRTAARTKLLPDKTTMSASKTKPPPDIVAGSAAISNPTDSKIKQKDCIAVPPDASAGLADITAYSPTCIFWRIRNKAEPTGYIYNKHYAYCRLKLTGNIK